MMTESVVIHVNPQFDMNLAMAALANMGLAGGQAALKVAEEHERAILLSYNVFFGVNGMKITDEKTIAACASCNRVPRGPYLPVVLRNQVTAQSFAGCICLKCLKKKIGNYEDTLPLDEVEVNAAVEGMKGILAT